MSQFLCQNLFKITHQAGLEVCDLFIISWSLVLIDCKLCVNVDCIGNAFFISFCRQEKRGHTPCQPDYSFQTSSLENRFRIESNLSEIIQSLQKLITSTISYHSKLNETQNFVSATTVCLSGAVQHLSNGAKHTAIYYLLLLPTSTVCGPLCLLSIISFPTPIILPSNVSMPFDRWRLWDKLHPTSPKYWHLWCLHPPTITTDSRLQKI